MRNIPLLALVLIAAPALAAPADPPVPPPIVWEVWGFKWEGKWVKQPTHCLATTDLKQAIAYAQEVFSFAGWATRKNLPGFCMTLYSYSDTAIPEWAGTPDEGPPAPVFTVWAFNLTDGKWVKSDDYSWDSSKWPTSDGRLVALDLVNRINAVTGWKATTNAPACDLPVSQREAYGGYARGSQFYQHYHDDGGGWSRRGFRVPSDEQRKRWAENDERLRWQDFQQSMDDFNRSMQNQ